MTLFASKPKPATSASQQAVLDDALLSAAVASDLGAMRKALERGARVDARLENDSPAMAALPKGKPQGAIREGRPASLGICCHFATSPSVSAALASKAMECSMLLIERGADSKAPPRSTCSAIGCATQLGSFDAAPRGTHLENQRRLIRSLAKAGADLDSIGPGNKTALERCLINETAESSQLLAEMGADVDSRDGQGRTMLWRLAYDGFARAFPAALELGADIDLPDFEWRTPLMACLDKFSVRHLSCARALIARNCRLTGAEFGAMTSDRWPAAFHLELAMAEAKQLRDSLPESVSGAAAAPRL